MSELEDSLSFQLKSVGIPFTREYRFGAIAAGGIGKGVRKRLADAGLKDWRFDFEFGHKIALEIEGGGWIGGKHTTGKGFADDLEKYDAAMRLGWIIYRCDGAMVKTGRALQTIELLIRMEKDNEIR